MNNKLCFIVCGNGYGHIKRVCDVIDNITLKTTNSEILIVGATDHKPWAEEWLQRKQYLSKKVRFENGLTEKNITANISSQYSFSDYRTSWQLINQIVSQFKPDKIVSDNLAGILESFPNSILMGSFLWSDVLKAGNASAEQKKIVELEDNLLKKTKPVMLGVEDIVMPAVKVNTNFVGLPWFCEKAKVDESRNSDHVEDKKQNILVTGGGTGILSRELVSIASSLNAAGKFNLFLDHKLYKSLARTDQFRVFDFTGESFSKIHWIVCRPGVGILTDAVKFNIPVCVVADDNPEIIHNAKRVEELGMGFRYKKNIALVMERFTAGGPEFKEQIRNLKTEGASQAAGFILNSGLT